MNDLGNRKYADQWCPEVQPSVTVRDKLVQMRAVSSGVLPCRLHCGYTFGGGVCREQHGKGCNQPAMQPAQHCTQPAAGLLPELRAAGAATSLLPLPIRGELIRAVLIQAPFCPLKISLEQLRLCLPLSPPLCLDCLQGSGLREVSAQTEREVLP